MGYLETSNKIWCKHFSLVFAILIFKLDDLSGERTDWHLIDILAEYRYTLNRNHWIGFIKCKWFYLNQICDAANAPNNNILGYLYELKKKSSFLQDLEGYCQIINEDCRCIRILVDISLISSLYWLRNRSYALLLICAISDTNFSQFSCAFLAIIIAMCDIVFINMPICRSRN